MKITRKQKLEIAIKNVEDGVTLKELSKEYNYDIASIKYVVSLYRVHGKEIFLGAEEKRIHTRDMKLKLIEIVKMEKRSIRSVASEYGLMDPTILGDWIKLYDKKGEQSIQTTRKRAPYKLKKDKIKEIEDKKLQDRIKYLEAENEYLKKLHTLVLSKTSQKKK